MSNEIELYSKLQNPIEAIERIGAMFAKSGMFGCDRVEQGQVLAMVCLSERKSPVEITRRYHIVEGKLSKKALAALAEFRQSGGKHRWIKSGDDTAATPAERYAEAEFVAPDGNKLTYRYSMADAAAEGLLKDKSRWVKRPGNMLRARVISNALGMLCPELYAGEDSEQDEAPAAPAALNLTATPPAAVVTPAAEPAPTQAAIVVESTTTPVADEPELAAQGLAPVIQPTTTPPPANGIPETLVTQLETAIGDDGVLAVAWMVRNSWLQPGQTLDNLTETQAKRVLHAYATANGDPAQNSFIRAIRQGAA